MGEEFRKDLSPRSEEGSQTPPSPKNMVLVLAGAPLWIPLVIAAGAVVFSVWISLWSVVVSLWAAVAALAGGAVGGIVACGILLWDGDVSSGLLMISGTLVCAGLAILLFFVSRWATRGMVHCTGKLIGWIRRCVGRKEQGHE